jgi:peptide/nickel transport system permease protein
MKMQVQSSPKPQNPNKFLRMLKFIFIPRYRLQEFESQERELKEFQGKRGFLKRMNAPLTILGIVIVLFIFVLATFAPWLTPYSYADLQGIQGNYYDPPSLTHPFGTSEFGRDVLGRFIWGSRSSLTMGFTAVIGLISAYFGGWFDNIVMRLMDIVLALPGLVLALVIIGILGKSVEIITLAFGVLDIPYYARLVRGSVLTVKQSIYVEAARVAGASDARIMFRHVLLNCLSPIIVSFTFDVGGIILSLAGISFLGFGDPQMIEWGNDLSIARSKIMIAPWASFAPGIGILLTVFGFMLLGDGLRDALDPRLKNL